LERHDRDHGKDFGTRGPRDYAKRASDFFKQSQSEGLPTKIDGDGVIRTYDPKTRTFGSYNPDGSSRTIFKPPRGQAYWDKQPGNPPWIPFLTPR
jgi:pyocin large subunit-like protein